MQGSFRIVIVAVLALAAIGLVGCEASVGTPPDNEQLQRIISEQLPDKLKQEVDKPKVTKVGCVKNKDAKYDCVASVTYLNDGKKESQDLSILGSCDEENCMWETKD